MNTRSNPDAGLRLDPTLAAWLELGPTELADRVIERARLRVHETRQRRPWRAPWVLQTQVRTRLAATFAVAAVVIALVGVDLRLASTPAVGTHPSPSPSARIGSFQPTGSMSTPPAGHTATVLRDGRVLVAGGTRQVGGEDPTRRNATGPVSSAELYDPATGSGDPAYATAELFH